MLQHKIFEIFITFSKDDIRRFREFLNSPFFNKSEKLVKLFEALIIFHPEFNSGNLTEEKIYKKVNPGLAFNVSTFRNQLFDLSNAADNFLIFLNFNERDFLKKDCLRDEQFKRKLKKQLEAGIKKAELSLKEVKSFNSDYFLNKFHLTNDIINYNIIFKPKTGNEAIVTAINNLTDNGKNITGFFIKEISRVFDNLQSLKKTFDLNKEDNFVFSLLRTMDFEKFLTLLIEKSNNDQDSSIFKLYLARYMAFTNFSNEKFYFDYKKILLKNIGFLSTDEIRAQTISLLRYCSLKSNQHDSNEEDKFKKERFDIYIFILDNNYYKAKVTTYLPVELFRTILHLSLDLKKYTWAYEFIKKYKSKLPPDRMENMYHFSCAEYFFCRGKYSEAMKSFHKVKFDHFMLKIDMRNLMLKTYYELEMYENALSLIDTYRHFFNNDKTLSADEKRMNKNFVNVIHKMIMYRTNENKTGKYKIGYELNRKLSNKEWVLDKFDQLDKKFIRSA